jgi:hypothetical protein
MYLYDDMRYNITIDLIKHAFPQLRSLWLIALPPDDQLLILIV